MTSSKGYICRKNDGSTSPDGGGTPAPTPPTGDAGVPSPVPPKDSGPPGKDTTAPKVTISSPLDQANVASAITVGVKATDNVGVVSVELMVDGVLMASKTAQPYDFPTVLQPGKHTVTVVAYDKATNAGQASISVTVGGSGTPAPPPPKLDAGAAPSPGGDGGASIFGSRCTRGSDCQSKLCAFDPALNDKYCTQQCGVRGWCPAGSACTSQPGGNPGLCALTMTTPGAESAGCSVGNGAAAVPVLGLLMLLGVLVRRRRWRE